MKTHTSISSLGNRIGNAGVYMMMGHGARNQFRRISDVYKILRKISSGIEKDATMLYF